MERREGRVSMQKRRQHQKAFKPDGFPGVQEHGMFVQQAIRNLGDPIGDDRMIKRKIKKDNFKTSVIPLSEVRSSHSSEEVG